jgi:GMP synthase-like glutamine amidotransferase
MARALFLRHHLEDDPGLVGEAFAARAFEIHVAMMDRRSATPTVEGFDVLVILGSKSSVYDIEVEAAWFGRELSLIDEAARRAIPILGICFGAQALCRFFGGIVEPSDQPELGWYEVQAHNDSGIAPGPWFEYHFDRCQLPDVAQLWASSARAVQAFAIGPNVGVQFHPEIDDVQLTEWFEVSDGDVREFGADPDQLLLQTRAETPAARRRARDLVDLFLVHAGLLNA